MGTTFEVATFRWFCFFVLVVQHLVAVNGIRGVLGKDALSMMEHPEFIAAGSGLSMLRPVAH